MTHTLNTLRLISLCTAVLLCSSVFTVHAQRRSKKRLAGSAARSESVENNIPALADGQVRLKLSNGTLVPVDDAWESAQGIWYKQGGITHLLPHDRVKTIERGSAVQ